MFWCTYWLILWAECYTTLLNLHVQGQTLSLSPRGSATAIEGSSFQFTCTIPEVPLWRYIFTGGVMFYTGTNNPFNLCEVNIGNCSRTFFKAGYTCGCGQTRVFYINITSVKRKDDDRNWRCQSITIPSNTVSLDVHYPPVIISLPSKKGVTEKTSPNIDCSSNITPGNPSSTSYRWTGPGGYSNTGAVLDRTVTMTQGGQYTCTATNTAGLSDTATVNINVQYPPVITPFPSNKDVRENTSLNIDCSSNITPGNPSSTIYRWTGPGGYSKTGAVLDRTITRTQGGQYTCTATNTAGLSYTATVNINVQYVPSINIPTNKDVTEKTSPNIDCSSNITPGNPSSTSYRWTGPGGYNKTGAVLDRTVNRTQGGQYTCTATNTVGLSDTATVNINVQISPKTNAVGSESYVAGGAVAGILVVIIIVVIVVLYKRGTFRTIASSQRNRRHNEQNATVSSDPGNTYSDLDHSGSERRTYTGLSSYQNVQTSAQDGDAALYEGIQEKSYENIQIPTSERNTADNNKESAYQNTSYN